MMRAQAMFALAATAGVLAFVPPATAQDRYYDDGYAQEQCARENRDRMVGSVIIGAIVGGVIGNNAAAGGHQGDGTLVGGLLGGITGGAVGNASQNDCGDQYGYADDPRYASDPRYADDAPYPDDEYSD